jgi:multicomponent Na+:H+ antiporter subunit B
MIGLLILFAFVALVVVSVMIIAETDFSQSVILYMGFGLGSTLLYFVFSAPDVALTEAVIGAGVSGVIFLVALLQTQRREQ